MKNKKNMEWKRPVGINRFWKTFMSVMTAKLLFKFN